MTSRLNDSYPLIFVTQSEHCGQLLGPSLNRVSRDSWRVLFAARDIKIYDIQGKCIVCPESYLGHDSKGLSNQLILSITVILGCRALFAGNSDRLLLFALSSLWNTSFL